MPISKRHAVFICRFIKNKSINRAIEDLELVIKFKKAVPFKGEIPHRKGKIMSGRYPVKASRAFIKILKGLRGNAIIKNLDLEKTRIIRASSTWSSRPLRRQRRRAKRTNLILTASEVTTE